MTKGIRQLRGVMSLTPSKPSTVNTKLLVTTIIVSALTLHQLYLTLRYILHARYLQDARWYNSEDTSLPCTVPEDTRAHMLTLLTRTLHILSSINVAPAVCFGTLWGVLRNQNLLPWDNNIDICVLSSNLSSIDVPKLRRLFASENITLSEYDVWRGHYALQFGKASGFLTVFFDCTGWYYSVHSELGNDVPDYLPPEVKQRPHWACPSGIRHWLLHDLPDVYQPFPMWLLLPPYRQLSLSGTEVPVPHDNFEMQKYLYPKDWWLERSPLKCVNRKE